ncbi:MAG: VOC family protein, partial [Bacteroidota bacterium]
MLARFPAFFTFSTHDIPATHTFYEQTLGLEVHRNARGFLELYLPGNNTAVIYAKADHKPANYTVLNFEVQNIERIVDDLRDKGVVFEQYGPPIA